MNKLIPSLQGSMGMEIKIKTETTLVVSVLRLLDKGHCKFEV
jgi:hypothetical protein